MTSATEPFRMPRGLITVLKLGGSVSALIFALTALFVEIFVAGYKNWLLGTYFWGFALLGIAAALVGVILDRQDVSSAS